MLIRHLFIFAVLLFSFTNLAHSSVKTVIATNGAGKGLIEHTLPAITLAATTDVDYIELHVVMTADDQLLVFQDLTLNRLTNVADIFPNRNREDGGFYLIDFTLNEIRQLRLKNIFETEKDSLSLAIPTLSEELSLIRRLEELLDKKIGIALEIKHPWFHKDAGKTISEATLDTIAMFGYGLGKDKFFIQCFDPEELQLIGDKLMPEKQLNIPLIQLIGKNDGNETKQKHLGRWAPYSYDWLYTNIGLRIVASYASAIALPSALIVDQSGNMPLARYIEDLHKYGLQVFSYTLDNKPQTFPSFAKDFPALLDFYFTQAKIDGIYTDSYINAQNYFTSQKEAGKRNAGLPSFFSNMKFSKPTSREPEKNDNNTVPDNQAKYFQEILSNKQE